MTSITIILRKSALLFFLATISATAIAQQQPFVSQFMLNNYFMNPAATSESQLSVTALHRTQWSGYQDYTGANASQKTDFFNASFNPDSTGHNMGLQLVQDKIASLTSRTIQISYAYRIALSSHSTLALGIRGGITSKAIDFDKFIIRHTDDPFINEGKQSETKPDITIGMWYKHKKYYAGISAKGIVTTSDFETLGIQNEKWIAASAGYHYSINKDWTLTPGTQVILTTGRTFIDANVLFQKEELFWTGLSYRHQEAVVVLAGFAMLKKQLHLSYAYDHVISNKSSKTSSSHEIMLRYQIGTWHPRKK